MRFILLLSIALLLLSDTGKAEQSTSLPPTISIQKTTNPTSAPFFLLSPNTTLQNTLYGICKHITNRSNHAIAYIPVAANTWPDYTGGKDQYGNLMIEVKPCKQ